MFTKSVIKTGSNAEANQRGWCCYFVVQFACHTTATNGFPHFCLAQSFASQKLLRGVSVLYHLACFLWSLGCITWQVPKAGRGSGGVDGRWWSGGMADQTNHTFVSRFFSAVTFVTNVTAEKNRETNVAYSTFLHVRLLHGQIHRASDSSEIFIYNIKKLLSNQKHNNIKFNQRASTQKFYVRSQLVRRSL